MAGPKSKASRGGPAEELQCLPLRAAPGMVAKCRKPEGGMGLRKAKEAERVYVHVAHPGGSLQMNREGRNRDAWGQGKGKVIYLTYSFSDTKYSIQGSHSEVQP